MKGNLMSTAARAALILGGIVAVAGPACAQTAPQGEAGAQSRIAGQAGADSPRNEVEDIVVTARRRAERLQETPISVTALTSTALARSSINNTNDLTRVTPNLQFASQSPSSGNNASSQIFIRGIGQTDFIPSSDPGVGLYVDGVYMARSVGGTTDFGDIERIEVLRGPQGTLFGRNTIGGAINIISQRPAKDFGGWIDVQGGSDNLTNLRGSVDLPITDGVYTKFQLVRKWQDGYVTHLVDGVDLGNVNALSARGSLLLEPASNFSAYIIADYSRRNEHGTPQVFNSINPNASFVRLASIQAGCPAPGTELADPRCANNQWYAGPFAENGTSPIHSGSEIWGISGTLEWQLPFASFKSITAYRSTDWDGFRDADNTPFVILNTQVQEHGHQFSQELQASGNLLDNRLKWLVGAYYFDESEVDDYQIQSSVGNFNQNGRYHNSSLAGFSQLSFDITRKLSLTVGGRYGTEWRRYTPEIASVSTYSFPAIPGYNATGTPPLNTPVSPGYTVLRSIDGITYVRPVNTVLPGDVVLIPNAAGSVTIPGGVYFYEPGQRIAKTTDFVPMASLSYKWTPNFFTYATYSEGFKAGGLNGRSTRPFVDVRAFGPEKAKSYEVGFKLDLAHGTIRINGDGFITNYDDVQISVLDGFAPVTINGGRSRIKGAELEWTFRPVRGLLINGGLGINHNKYLSLVPAAVAVGVGPHNSLPFSPKFTISNGIGYDVAWGTTTITPRLDWYHQSKVYFDAQNTEAISQRAYDLLNASVTMSLKGDWLHLTGAVTNLNNKLYRVAGTSLLTAAAGYAESTYARRREWSISARYRF